VQHQDPFYQLGKLYVYNLQVELFQYGSEKIDTGVPEIDVFEDLKSYSIDNEPRILQEDGAFFILEDNSGVIREESNTTDVSDSYGDNEKFKVQSRDLIFDPSNPFGEIT
jgi:hypothetical protein